jgi:hypothetical protein
MKKKLLLFVVLTTSLMFAQLPDAPSAASRFSVSASAMGVSGSGSATASTIAGGEVNLTKSFAIGYEQVLIPSLDANYHFATVSYTMPLTFGQKINATLVFDRSKWQYRFFGGVGVLRQSLIVNADGVPVQHIATELGAGLNYLAGDHVVINAISGRWLRAGIAGPLHDQFIVTPDQMAWSSGLGFKF